MAIECGSDCTNRRKKSTEKGQPILTAKGSLGSPGRVAMVGGMCRSFPNDVCLPKAIEKMSSKSLQEF